MGRLRSACAVVLAAVACAALPAAAGEPPREDEPAAELTSDELAAVKGLFRRLESAMTAGDERAVGALLSSTLPADERNRTMSRVRGELERFSYLRFRFALDEELPVDRIGPDEIEIVSVTAHYEYEARSASRDHMASIGPNSYRFRLAKDEGEWRIVRSDLFDQFTAWPVEKALGFIFLGGFLLVLAVFLWGWMALDAWMRTGRVWYALAIVASTPLGAGVYFFAVYLRRRFLPKDEP